MVEEVIGREAAKDTGTANGASTNSVDDVILQSGQTGSHGTSSVPGGLSSGFLPPHALLPTSPTCRILAPGGSLASREEPNKGSKKKSLG